jgi:hypothetical protein
VVIYESHSETHVRYAGLWTQTPLLTSVWKKQQNGILYSLRRLFAIIMVFCEASNIHYLWDKYFESMLEYYRRTMSNNLKCVQQMVLKDIDDIVSSMDKNIHDYGLPELDD